MKRNHIGLALLTMLVITPQIWAESAKNLAKVAQNPIANMISLPFQNNTNIGIGSGDERQNILNIQPVWPVTLSDEWNLITRTIIPVVSQPDILTNEGRVICRKLG